MKEQGELAEALFVVEALTRGFTMLSLHGDNAHYDKVVDNGNKLLKIQIKSTAYFNINPKSNNIWYTSTMSRGHSSKRKPYNLGDFDFAAILILPTKVWYIIPCKEVYNKRGISLCSNSSSKSKYNKYRDAWNLLR